MKFELEPSCCPVGRQKWICDLGLVCLGLQGMLRRRWMKAVIKSEKIGGMPVMESDTASLPEAAVERLQEGRSGSRDTRISLARDNERAQHRSRDR